MRAPTFERVPLESREPIVSFAVIRALIAAAALVALAILGFPYGGGALAAVAGFFAWSLVVLLVTSRGPEAGLSPAIVAFDFALLGVIQGVEPDLYAAVHFAALFMVAAHAHFQGEERGLLVGVVAAAALIPVTLATDVPVGDDMLKAYEPVFAVCALSVGLVVGALRTAESSGRLRARALSRREIDTESDVRRKLAEAIHDGPIQELSSVELMLASAEQAYARGDTAGGQHALSEARALTRDNITYLRDEIVELGPYAFEERSFEQAVDDCIDTWRRRHGIHVRTEITEGHLAPEIAGPLFRITQEAVTNAGRHAEATEVTIRLRNEADRATLEIDDNGHGFQGVDPLGPEEPGHIGLASMRERAEMLGGELAIESDGGGTRVRVSVPL